jgi:acyl carrier protein
VLGEGGAALVLEDWDRALARGARIHAEMSVTAPAATTATWCARPVGQARALRAALADAGLSPKTSATSMPTAPRRSKATRSKSRPCARCSVSARRNLPVSATKSMHGHLLGAAGAIEALATVLALREQAIPPTAHLAGRIDPACEGVDHVFEGRLACRCGPRCPIPLPLAAATPCWRSVPPKTPLRPTMSQAPQTVLNDLMAEVAALIVEALNLDVQPADIQPDDPLYGEGLGLDSIDMLEISLVISKQYGFQLKSDNENNVKIFASLRSLSEHIASQRTK